MAEPSTDHQIAEVWDNVGGLRLHGWTSTAGDPEGRRPPIVMVHGLGVSTLYLMPTFRKLAARYRVYAPDLPGFGRSEKPARVMGIEALSDVLEMWLKLKDIGRAVFVCNSMGCQVAIELAVRRPERVERLVLSGPTMDPDAGSAFVQVFRLVRDAMHEKPSLWFVAGFDYVRAWPMRVLESLRLAMAHHVERKLRGVVAPTLVVRGSHDHIAPRRWVQQMVEALPMGKIAEIQGTGHAVNYSAAEQFTRVIEEFICSESIPNIKP